MSRTATVEAIVINKSQPKDLVFTIYNNFTEVKPDQSLKYFVRVRNSVSFIADIACGFSSAGKLIIFSDTLNNLSPSRYGLTIVEQGASSTYIYPDNLYLDMLVTENTISVTGQSISNFDDDQSLNKSYESTLAIRGESAYEIAIRHGYSGSEEDWINDIQGSNVFTADIGNALDKEFNIAHNIGSNNLVPTVVRNYPPYDVVLPDISFIDSNNVKLTFSETPLTNEYNLTLISPKHSVRTNTVVSGAASDDWKDKTGIFFGDSITEVNFRAKVGYVQKIKDRTGLNAINKGISGTGYQTRLGTPYTLPDGADFIFVFMGTNDWGDVSQYRLPLGNFNDIDTSTVSGNIRAVLTGLVNRWYTIPIGVATPLPRIESYGKNGGVGNGGYTLSQLSDRIKEIAADLGMPVLDLYNSSDLYVYQKLAKNRLFSFDGTEKNADGLHPNTEGHEILSYKIQNFIRNYLLVGTTPQPSYSYTTNPETGVSTTLAIPSNIFSNVGASFGMNMPERWQSLFDDQKATIKNINVAGIDMGAPDALISNGPFWYEYAGRPQATLDLIAKVKNNLRQITYTPYNSWNPLKVTQGHLNSDGTTAASTDNFWTSSENTAIPAGSTLTIIQRYNRSETVGVDVAPVFAWFDSAGKLISMTTLDAKKSQTGIETTWTVKAPDNAVSYKATIQFADNKNTYSWTRVRSNIPTNGDSRVYMPEWISIDYVLKGA